MNHLTKFALVAALSGGSFAFGGFVPLVTTNFPVETGNGSNTNIYYADLGVYNVPDLFKVDFAVSSDFGHEIGHQSTENSKTFGSMAGGKYKIYMFLTDPTAPYNPGAVFNDTFDFTGVGKIAGVSYWDGRYGSYDPLQAVINLVGGPYVFDTVSPGRGLENHDFDGQPAQDAFSILGGQTMLGLNLWSYDTLKEPGDAFVDMMFVFVSPVPEPSAAILALTGGALGLLFYRNTGTRRRRA